MKDTPKDTQIKTSQDAAGKIDYTLMNDCMFHAVMQSNEKVLKGLVCALLRLSPDEVHTVTVLNPIEFSNKVCDKEYILDIKVSLNDEAVINIELQVEEQKFWNNRSLLYLCRIFDNLKKGQGYFDAVPTYHIGILDFTLFPDYPEFYATNKMMNVQKHYIYNDKFTLNVLDLNHTELATDEDKRWKLDYWARLFKAETWEELKMLAQQDDVFMETYETIFRQNQDDKVRMWCEAYEEAERVARTIEREHEHEIAQRDAIIAKQNSALAEKDSALAEKDSALAENKQLIAEREAEIARLERMLAEKNVQSD